MTEQWLPIVVSALVSVFTSVVYHEWKGMREQRRAATLSLLEEWHSLEMLQARTVAFRILKDSPELDKVTLKQRLDHTPDDWYSLSRVVHFLERLGALYRSGRLDERLLVQILGGYIGAWHGLLVGFQQRSQPDGWAAIGRILDTLTECVAICDT